MVIARMKMRNLALHGHRQIRRRQMIRQEKRIRISFQIRLPELDKVMIAQLERGKRRAEFLPSRLDSSTSTSTAGHETHIHNIVIRDLRQLPLRHDVRSHDRPIRHTARRKLLRRQGQVPIIALPVALGRFHPLHVFLRGEHLALERLEQRAHRQPADDIVRDPARSVVPEGAVVAVDGR